MCHIITHIKCYIYYENDRHGLGDIEKIVIFGGLKCLELCIIKNLNMLKVHKFFLF